MRNLYRVTPLEKNKVEFFVDVFECLPDGSVRGFDVTEVWSWGQAFRPEDEPVWKFEANGRNGVHCRPDVGWGCELEDLVAVYINFSDGFTDEERANIEALCRGEIQDKDGRCRTSWIYDGDHNWEIEHDYVRIVGPVKIDLVDASENSVVIEENVEPYDE